MKKSFTSGYGLVGILVGAFISSMVLVGASQVVLMSFQSRKVALSFLVEQDFLATINKVLTDEMSCKESLAPDNLTGRSDPIYNKGIGLLKPKGLSLKAGTDTVDSIIPVGTFKDSIEVVKMNMKPEGKDAQAQAANESKPVRLLTINYKKIGLGKLNTLANKDCTASSGAGCFKKKCKIQYELEDDPDNTLKKVKTCQVIDCHGGQVVQAGIGPACPWGQIFYNKKEIDKIKETDADTNLKEGCNARDTTEHLGAQCKGAGKVLPGRGGQDKTGREKKGDKCVCIKRETDDSQFCSNRKLTAEGLCIKVCQEYGAKHCWPRVDPSERPFGFGNQANISEVKTFCTKNYQGSEICIRHSNKFLKRIYNRETGEVKCVSYKPTNTSDLENLSESWFFPQPL